MAEKLHKINSQIQTALSYIILDKFPQYLCSITEVSTDSDLEISKIFVACGDEAGKIITLFNNASASIRYELAHKISLRKIPSLKFYPDQSGANFDRIDEILSKIPE